MQRILVIEDETVLRSNVARGLSKLGLEVMEASTLNDALKLIDRAAPDLVVSDIDLPERSGLELLGELGRRGLKPAVIFVSGYLNAYRAQIPHHASIEVLEKPVPIEELREAVLRRLGSSAGAEASPFSVPDYLQLACLGRHSVVVEVERHGQRLGRVVVSDGEIWSADDTEGSGLPALGRLAFGPGGGARCKRHAGALPARNLEGGWEYLLMEAARVMDESGRSGRDSPRALEQGSLTPELGAEQRALADELGLVLEADFAQAPRAHELSPAERDELAFASAWEQGVEALLSKNHQLALTAFVRASELRPNDSKVRANLKRLAELGYTREAPLPEG